MRLMVVRRSNGGVGLTVDSDLSSEAALDGEAQ